MTKLNVERGDLCGGITDDLVAPDDIPTRRLGGDLIAMNNIAADHHAGLTLVRRAAPGASVWLYGVVHVVIESA